MRSFIHLFSRFHVFPGLDFTSTTLHLSPRHRSRPFPYLSPRSPTPSTLGRGWFGQGAKHAGGGRKMTIFGHWRDQQAKLGAPAGVWNDRQHSHLCRRLRLRLHHPLHHHALVSQDVRRPEEEHRFFLLSRRVSG